MSTLADRIRGVLATAAAAPSSSCSSSLGDTCGIAQNVAAELGGEWRRGCLVVERRTEPSARHGRDTVAAVADRLQRGAREALLFAGGAPACTPFMFFDLETTGLNGGAGTYVFLVGCGWFENGEFLTRQFVLTRHADERPMLTAVAEELGRAGAIVSFNGKSFDAPVLETRYLFHRLKWVGADLPHLDVLHPARQFWKAIDRCSLVSLERQLVGHRRMGDVPGFEIPARYFQFVRTGDPRPLTGILAHNRSDLLSLAALTARLVDLAHRGEEAALDAREALALGRVYARAGLRSRARDAFMRSIALSAAPPGAYDPIRIESLRALALVLRRERQYEESARCWQRLIETRGCPAHVAREASEALAVHHEHRVRDLPVARVFALRSLEAAEPGTRTAWTAAVQHRLARIERKMGPRVGDTSGGGVTARLPFVSSSSRRRLSCAAPTSAHRTSS